MKGIYRRGGRGQFIRGCLVLGIYVPRIGIRNKNTQSSASMWSYNEGNCMFREKRESGYVVILVHVRISSIFTFSHIFEIITSFV